jgi:HSP20 family molecular chaperone IbpA
MKNMYEVFDEFEEATSKKERMQVIEKNLSQTLVQVLQLTYHPDYQWLVTELPENYILPDTLPGVSREQLSLQIRKLYLFRKGEPTAEKLTPEKRNQLLLQMLESLEPREAEVVIGIFRKDLGVKGLKYKFIKEAFPNLIP